MEGSYTWEYEMLVQPTHNHQWVENGQITNLIQIMFIAGVFHVEGILPN